MYIYLFYLFLHNFTFLIVKGNVKNLFTNTTRSVIASRSLPPLLPFQTHLLSYSFGLRPLPQLESRLPPP